jgi:hypothetical protein
VDAGAEQRGGAAIEVAGKCIYVAGTHNRRVQQFSLQDVFQARTFVDVFDRWTAWAQPPTATSTHGPVSPASSPGTELKEVDPRRRQENQTPALFADRSSF